MLRETSIPPPNNKSENFSNLDGSRADRNLSLRTCVNLSNFSLENKVK